MANLSLYSRSKTGQRFRVVAVSSVLLLTFAITGCSGGAGEGGDVSEGETINMTVGVAPTDTCMQPYYAEEQGFFEDVGLNVELQEFGAGGAVQLQAASGGSIDAGCPNSFSAVAAYEQGIEYVLIAPGALYQQGNTTSALVVSEDGPIESAEDMNGKTSAASTLQNITDVSVKKWVDENGGDSSSIEFVELPFPQMPAALDQGRVDSALMAEPFLSSSVDGEGGGRVLADTYSAIADEFLLVGWYSTRQWSEENPEAVSRYAEAMAQAAKWANENQDESAQILKDVSGQEQEVIDELTRVPYSDSTDAETLASLIEPLIQVGVDYEVISEPVDEGEVVADALKEN